MDIGPVDNRRPDHQPIKKSLESKPSEEFQRSPAIDRAEISLEARQKLSELANSARASESEAQTSRVEGLDGQQRMDDDLKKAGSLDQIRERIESGYYERPEVRDQIAGSMSDDIES